jgi:hypothetical protein
MYAHGALQKRVSKGENPPPKKNRGYRYLTFALQSHFMPKGFSWLFF